MTAGFVSVPDRCIARILAGGVAGGAPGLTWALEAGLGDPPQAGAAGGAQERPVPGDPGAPGAPPAEAVAERVQGCHLRAARAMLGWAMADLARASGLSLSTVRRLEQNAQGVSPRSREAVVGVLAAGGIRFLALPDGTLALAEPVPARGP